MLRPRVHMCADASTWCTRHSTKIHKLYSFSLRQTLVNWYCYSKSIASHVRRTIFAKLDNTSILCCVILFFFHFKTPIFCCANFCLSLETDKQRWNKENYNNNGSYQILFPIPIRKIQYYSRAHYNELQISYDSRHVMSYYIMSCNLSREREFLIACTSNLSIGHNNRFNITEHYVYSTARFNAISHMFTRCSCWIQKILNTNIR